MNPITNFFCWLGLTRDSLLWFWSRLVAGSLLVAAGVVPLEEHIGPKWAKVAQLAAVLVLWLAGKYDSSPLPGDRRR